jgi:hypothetical protein
MTCLVQSSVHIGHSVANRTQEDKVIVMDGFMILEWQCKQDTTGGSTGFILSSGMSNEVKYWTTEGWIFETLLYHIMSTFHHFMYTSSQVSTNQQSLSSST